jgi:hypothetical protein
MYRYEVPCDHNHAIRLDQHNGNTKWQDSIKLEMNQLHEYETFKDHGHKDSASLPRGYQTIRVHLVFVVRYDGHHKARCVADGHLTDIPFDSVYSGVVSLRAICLVLFLAKLNRLETWTTYIDSTYLEAKTQEKVYIIAGSEFDDLDNHILIINRGLYGLCNSGLCWHGRFADCLH